MKKVEEVEVACKNCCYVDAVQRSLQKSMMRSLRLIHERESKAVSDKNHSQMEDENMDMLLVKLHDGDDERGMLLLHGKDVHRRNEEILQDK